MQTHFANKKEIKIKNFTKISFPQTKLTRVKTIKKKEFKIEKHFNCIFVIQ